MAPKTRVRKLRVALVGLGYWGRNILRNFLNLEDVEVAACCDTDPAQLQPLRRRHPAIRFSTRLKPLLDDRRIHALVLATPAVLHAGQTRIALEAGKHVWVEKPLALSSGEAEAIRDLAERRGRVVLVGHTFLYNDAVRRVKEALDRKELGRIHYVYAQRLNLGRVRSDVNVVWNLAPHDVSILLYWFGEAPRHVSAQGICCLQPNLADAAFLHLTFGNGCSAHIHVSWLDPQKVRRMTLVGDRKMLCYDDLAPDEKIRIYDKGIDRQHLSTSLGEYQDFAQFQFIRRAGDLTAPKLAFREPLAVQARHFVDCIRGQATPLTDAAHGAAVVRVLEAAQRSMDRGGAPEEIT